MFVRDEATLIIGSPAIPLGRMGPQDGFRPQLQGVRHVVERVAGIG
ncbi:hypothetical protein KHC28_04490 [Ancylobacter sonchi]|nr:hypothetical protein [Ancylobacter sonchi]MBS7532913.1 hypothetical protein [Ancylobacter sonchi]